MLLPLLFAAALTAAPTPGFDEALARADRYEDQFMDYRAGKLYPLIAGKIPQIANLCSPEQSNVERRFVLVVSFQDGRFAKVETDNADPAAACYQAELAKLDYPAPPAADFAEKINMELAPDDAEPPGQAGKPDKH